MQRNHHERTTPNTFVLKSLFFFWSCVKKTMLLVCRHPSILLRSSVSSLFHISSKKNTLVHKTMFLLLFSPILFSINSTISHPPRFIILLISIYIHIHAANTPTYCLTEYQNKMERQHREILFFTIILLRSTCILK